MIILISKTQTLQSMLGFFQLSSPSRQTLPKLITQFSKKRHKWVWRKPPHELHLVVGVGQSFLISFQPDIRILSASNTNCPVYTFMVNYDSWLFCSHMPSLKHETLCLTKDWEDSLLVTWRWAVERTMKVFEKSVERPEQYRSDRSCLSRCLRMKRMQCTEF